VRRGWPLARGRGGSEADRRPPASARETPGAAMPGLRRRLMPLGAMRGRLPPSCRWPAPTRGLSGTRQPLPVDGRGGRAGGGLATASRPGPHSNPCPFFPHASYPSLFWPLRLGDFCVAGRLLLRAVNKVTSKGKPFSTRPCMLCSASRLV
jgi:hypothetical protein